MRDKISARVRGSRVISTGRDSTFTPSLSMEGRAFGVFFRVIIRQHGWMGGSFSRNKIYML